MANKNPKRLLIIDDDKLILSSTAAYLEDCNYEVLQAEDGDKGLEVFEKEQPDVVLLDLRMPNVDGLDVLAYLTEESPDIPVIVISGTGFIQDAIESLRLGAWDFILKPVTDLAIIKHAVEKALERITLLKENQRHKEYLGEQVAQRTADLEKRTWELQQAKEAAEAASRAKSDFLSTMSHELRTPMNGILGTAQLLQGSVLTDDQKELVDVLLRSGSALMKILNEILDLSKIEANNIEIESIDFNLVETIESNIHLFFGAANSKGLTLNWNKTADLPRKLVGDPYRLGQVLSNLLGNAIKFTDSGGITIQTCSLEETDSVVVLQIDVTDTGIGISHEDTESIFQPFTQVDSSVTRRFGGTGLGLTIVRDIVKLMGGTVSVDSRPGCGSTFSVRLPFGKHSRSPSLSLEKPLENQTTTIELPPRDVLPDPNQRLSRLLVVEDDKINQMVIVGMLTKLGYEVDVASNGKEAVTCFQQQHYDLVFMDCLMPEMDGFEATKEIRRVEMNSGLPNQTPIIAFTAKAMKGDREMCLSAGMNNYLTKPVTIEKLTSMLNTI